MRNPGSLLDGLSATNKHDQTIVLKHIPEYDYEDWNLADEKDFTRFIATIEKNVRQSFEYSEYIRYLKSSYHMNSCAFLKYVRADEDNKIKIHIHHEPLTLYDICIIVFRKRQALGEPLDEESLSKEVMWNHYNGYVGLIPLCETIHELVHARYIFVPSTHVYGNYKEFVKLYNAYFTIDQLDYLKDIEEASKNFNMERCRKLLSSSFTYVDDDGAYGELPSKQELVNTLQAHRQELFNKNSFF